jgi:uridine kinase
LNKCISNENILNYYSKFLILAGESVQLPKYDFCNHCRVPNDYTTIKSADVVLVEGILIFFDKELRDLFDIKLFVDADPDIRLASEF